jgi:hypothetical protein
MGIAGPAGVRPEEPHAGLAPQAGRGFSEQVLVHVREEEGLMVRRYGDPVDVRRQDEKPGQFLWRGRLYVVRSVLAHWVEAGRWWAAPSAQAVYAADITGDTTDGTGDVATSVPPTGPAGTGLDDGEREVWRVEAAAGRGDGVGVYDLCFDWSAGAWTLLRALD